MTLGEKIRRFMSETREQRVGAWTAAPPIIRLLWLLRLDVPPPLYWSFTTDATVFSGFFGFFIFCIGAFGFGKSWPGEAFSSILGGILFGLVMASFTRRRAFRLRLSRWDSPTASGPA